MKTVKQNGESFTVEFSPDQNCFHIGTLKEHLQSNFSQIVDKRQKDRWLMLFVHSDIEKCHKYIESFKSFYANKNQSDIYVDYEIQSMLNE